jgi:hypothetical protein
MRFIITSRRDETNPPEDENVDPAVFVAYMKFNEELQTAGVLVASEGLTPGTPGARVVVSGGRRKAIDGPFAESKELVGGFYIVDVPSLAEAKAWALRCPVGLATADVLEVRQLTGAEDIPAPFLEMAKEVAPNWTASIMKARAKP